MRGLLPVFWASKSRPALLTCALMLSTTWPPCCLNVTQGVKICQSWDTLGYLHTPWEAHAQVCEQGTCSKPFQVSGILPLQASCEFGELSVLSVTIWTRAPWHPRVPQALYSYMTIISCQHQGTTVWCLGNLSIWLREYLREHKLSRQ